MTELEIEPFLTPLGAETAGQAFEVVPIQGDEVILVAEAAKRVNSQAI